MLDRTVNFQNKFHFTSLGCARNLVDSEVMIGILLKAGYEHTPHLEEADYLVVNTCGFLEASRQEGIETIADLFKHKKSSAKVIVAGCMVQKHSGELKERFPEIHYLLGSGDVEKILDAVTAGKQGEAVTSARSYLEWGEVPRTLSTPKHYAYLKIAEGCRKRCAFCIIPTIKGPLKSKTEEQVLKEFKALLSRGVFEVILIAQDLGDFGKDRREKGALAKLLREMLKVEGDFWLRLLYLYPDEIDDELIDVMKSDPRLCHYLDMPIQHINDRMLKAMHRTTSKQEILHILERLRREIPNVAIRTSLMVGFPGETEEEFEELLSFVKTVPLDHVGVFKFSLEKEAYAAKLPDQIPEEVKEKRFERLVTAQLKATEKRNKKWIGRKVRAIVEGYHPESKLLLRARHSGQCPDIDGMIIVNDAQGVDAFGKNLRSGDHRHGRLRSDRSSCFTAKSEKVVQALPHLKLKKGKEKPILQRHHWIYSGAIATFPQTEGLAEVESSSGDILGIALLNKGHSISAHMLAFGKETIEEALKSRIREAAAMRRRLFDPAVTNAIRLINAEGDGIPGLVVDSYAGILVLQISHPALDSLKDLIVTLLIDECAPVAIYEKSTSFLRKKSGLEEARGLLHGEPFSEVEVLENGLKFSVDIQTGQKTGLFLDQREMRALVRENASGRRVLNGFAYTGGFSIAALQGGASHVDSVEISARCQGSIEKNLALNNLSNHQFIEADVFEFLKTTDLRYDLIVLDPPAFVKKRESIATGFRAYKELNRETLAKMPSGSLLLTCSCSYHVDEPLFQNILFRAALEAKRKVKILSRHRQALDHPVSLFHPESSYLKSFLLYVE